MELLPPKAERYGTVVSRRLENRAVRAYDRYKLEQKQMEAARIRLLAHTQKEETTSMRSEDETLMGLYVGADLVGDDVDDDLSSTASGASREGNIGICGKFCEKLFTTSTRPYILKWWQFLPMLIFLNTSITYNANCVRLCSQWGAIIVLIMLIILQIVIASSLYLAYMFLGSYSRRSYIRFWDCVPLMKGLGYSILLFSMIGEVFNIAFSGLVILYLLPLIMKGRIPWANCDFPNAHPDCIPMWIIDAEKGPYRHNTTCCSAKECGNAQLARDSAKFSALDYYMSYIMKRGYGEKPLHDGLLPAWVATVVVLWLVLCFLMTIGLRKFRKILTIIDVVILIAMTPSVILSIIMCPHYALAKEMQTDYKNIFNGEMWLDFIAHYLYREIPSDVIAVSALSVPLVSTTSDTVIIYTVKVFWSAMGIVWTSITAKSAQENYRIRDDRCIMIRGDLLVLVLIPNSLAWMPLGYLFVISFFTIILFWNLSISVYILNNGLEALLDEFLILHRFRFPIAMLISTMMCVINVQILRPDFMEYFQLYVGETAPTIIASQLIAAWIGLLLYSMPKLLDDYHFTFGRKLSQYWIFGLKLGTVVFCILIILLYSQNIVRRGKISVCVAILWPIPTGMVVMILRYYIRVNNSLLDPHPMWGPPTKKRRYARSLFDPAHDSRYRSARQKCKHHCLVRSAAVKREIRQWQTKLEVVIMVLEDENYNFGDDKPITVYEGSQESSRSIIN